MSKFKKGFSLVELLVVIAIIGILAAVGITAYSGYTSSAKEKATLANHAQILALLNSEFAKCAAGAGDFVWGSGGSSCASNPNAGQIVSHFTTEIDLMNPYNRTEGQVSEAYNTDGAVWNGLDAQNVSVVGQTAVFCNDTGCSLGTNQSEGAADTYASVATY